MKFLIKELIILVVIYLTHSISYLIFSFACLALTGFFIYYFSIAHKLEWILKSVGYGLLAVGSIISLIQQTNSNMTYVFYFGFLSIIAGMLLDKHTNKLPRFCFILPILAPFILHGHVLLFAMAIMTVLAKLQLVHNPEHNRLTPIIISLSLVAMGEYFLIVGGKLTDAAYSLNIFAALIILTWIVQHLIWKMFHLETDNSHMFRVE